ncbi:hypothetical protein HDU67_006037 [Dinochytrium kinnereticum]|nr:hypothetical protein HDU67_006037 [Dinochytrium kinnereticum]
MKVNVLYFASARDAAGTASETIDLAAGSGPDAPPKNTLRDVVAMLKSRHPDLEAVLSTAMIAVNQEYVERDLWANTVKASLSQAPESFVQDGDEVGVIPPVSGG